MRWIWVFVSACLIVCGLSADEPKPAAVADLATLQQRVQDLEQRVREIEARWPAPASVATLPAVQDLPTLEIHSETWCGPCQTLKAELQALGETGVNVKWVRFSDRVPALRWVGSDGKLQVQTGYTRGTIGSLLERVKAAHVARLAGKE
jgi:hypothetical protein